ncbi:hypothetical protein QL285_032973 [Trifolium repens]|nr:hypothetical protein QL285_032973 [Trifolium repens]
MQTTLNLSHSNFRKSEAHSTHSLFSFTPISSNKGQENKLPLPKKHHMPLPTKLPIFPSCTCKDLWLQNLSALDYNI